MIVFYKGSQIRIFLDFKQIYDCLYGLTLTEIKVEGFIAEYGRMRLLEPEGHEFFAGICCTGIAIISPLVNIGPEPVYKEHPAGTAAFDHFILVRACLSEVAVGDMPWLAVFYIGKFFVVLHPGFRHDLLHLHFIHL